MKGFKLLKNTKGITLIALVVTIVVLLILAAVSISMLTGENGIITQAQQSKDKTEQAKCEELVTVAINGLIAENSGDRSKITPEKIAEQVNKENNRSDVTAEGSTFPTNIIFNEEGRKVGVDIELAVTGEIKEEIYSAEVSEEDIAPANIFLYELIEGTGETASTEWDSLPTKEARIVGIKPEYCNFGGYNPETGNKEYEDTNYEITLEDGTKITETLVVPYQVEGQYIEGAYPEEMYKITEVDLAVYWGSSWAGFGYTLPNVETIIYPNTVKVINGKEHSSGNPYGSNSEYLFRTIKDITFPNKLETIGNNAFMDCTYLVNITIPNSVTCIGDCAFFTCRDLKSVKLQNGLTKIGKNAFSYCGNLTNITLPNSITNIGEEAFSYCSSLTNITIPNSVTSMGKGVFNSCDNLSDITMSNNIVSIEDNTFSYCYDLTNITIPNSVTNIGQSAFSYCSSLTSIIIPNSVTNIGDSAFSGCSSLTNITIPNSVTNIGYRAFDDCSSLTTVNYTGTEEEWNNIRIDYNGNSNLRNATINYNYKGE